MTSVNMYSGKSGTKLTWVYGNSNSSNNNSSNSSILYKGCLLKGWHKTQTDSTNDPIVKLDAKDVLDLNAWKYSHEVPILDHTLVANLAASELEDGLEDELEDEENQSDVDVKPGFIL